MSSMSRTIARSIARRNGRLATVKKGNTVARRNQRPMTLVEMLASKLRRLRLFKKESEA